MRGKAEIEEGKSGKQQIIITELPYQVKTRQKWWLASPTSITKKSWRHFPIYSRRIRPRWHSSRG